MFEIYAYGNVDTLTGVFNAIAAIMGGADYLGLIRTIALTGVLVAAFAGLFTPGRFQGWGWLMGFLIVYYAMFLPKADVVVVDKLGNQTPAVIGNVPIGVAFFGHYTSLVGDVMTRFFETAFQVIPDADAQLPEALTYQRNGVLFGNRLIQATRSAQVADPQLKADLIAYVYNCTVYDLQDGTIDAATFSQSADIWSLMGNPNPARFTNHGSPVTVDTCPNVYTLLSQRLPAEVNQARAMLALQLNPAMNPNLAAGAIDNQIEQAYTKARIAAAAQGAGDLLRQNILINLVQDTHSLAGLKLNDPAATMLATARANATASTNAGFLTMGHIAAQALPMIRNVIEAVIYAVFPFVFLLFLLAQGRGLALALKSFVMSLVWIQLWPPLYAILNYVATLASARNLAAAAQMGTGQQGLALDTAAAIYQGAIADQAIAGYLVAAIPIIATAIIKGGEVAFQAITASSAIQSSAASEAASASKGLVSQNSVSFDQQQLGATRTSPFMASRTDGYGTTIQGLGPDAGLFRYQATMSRLASTFTVSERQANTLGENARQAESLATSEREAMQRSQTAALTQALGIQDSFEQSRQRSGATSITEGSSTSTQIQQVQSIAREVNKKLGLREDSTVGTTIASSASVGLKIPLTELGASAKAEGRTVDQQALSSAYDYARKAAESAQLTDTAGLLKDFRSSAAYQWARSQRSSASDSLESSLRDASERQSSSEAAYSQSRELARTAQFMREWSSGTQTDFTNYAAQRLAERGLLREEDPIRLQHAVNDIAMAYARGGDGSSGYVPPLNPLGPTPTLSGTLGWTEGLRTSYDQKRQGMDNDLEATAEQQANTVRSEQTASGVRLGQPVRNDLQSTLDSANAQAKQRVDTGRSQVDIQSGQLSKDYRDNVQPNQLSRHHGGNPAVWETVGANAEMPDLGTPPETRPVGEWHMGEDGVPRSGPDPSRNGKTKR